MRAFRECVFNDTIMGTTTVYTSTKWNRLLASSPQMVIQAVAANVVSPGAPGKLSIHLQISGDGRNWLDKYSTPEIDDADQSEGAVTTTVGYDDGAEPSMSQARFEITTSGNTDKMHLKLWVTGRAVVPGSVRQAVAARRAAELSPAQADTQALPAQAPKPGGCGEACGCGGTCGGSAGAARANTPLLGARVAPAAARRGRRISEVDLNPSAAWRALIGSGSVSRIWDTGGLGGCYGKLGQCVAWCGDEMPNNYENCSACCEYHKRKCDGKDTFTPTQEANKDLCTSFHPKDQFDPRHISPAPPAGGKKKDECEKVSPKDVELEFDVCLGLARLQHGLRCDKCPSPLNPEQRAACVADAAERFKDEFVDCFETAKCKCVHRKHCGWFRPGDKIPVPECKHPFDDLPPNS